MLKLVFSALCFLGAATAAPLMDTPATRAQFEEFAATHQKSYGSKDELTMRYSYFLDNMGKAAALNAEHAGTAVFGATKFADLSVDEFRTHYMNRKRDTTSSSDGNVMKDVYVHPSRRVNWNAENDVNATVDWRLHGAISPVKDQGQCGSCWAFSVTEEVESMTFLAGNDLPVLAPQQIVDCDTKGQDQGCNGGFTEGGYAYVQSAGGMDTEASYPYTARDGSCKFSASDVAAQITGYTYAVPKCTVFTCASGCQGMEEALQTAPVSVCVDAEPWQMYISGILKDSQCKKSPLMQDHCVQLTGYDTDSSGAGFWVVRNSWGADWGEKGSIYLERGSGGSTTPINTCGVCDDATIATVAPAQN